jgi:hypothetical protein
MIYMIILGVISLLFSKVAIGSIHRLVRSGGDEDHAVLPAVVAFIVLSLSQGLILGLCFVLVLNSGNGAS